MKILWLTNVKLPIIYRARGEENKTNVGGWLDRISQGLLENEGVRLHICYPYGSAEEGEKGALSYKSLEFNAIAMRLGKLNDNAGIEQAKEIIKSFGPDIIHIHGTEYQYHWFFAEAARQLGIDDRLVVSIQGMVGVYAKHYCLGLPAKVRYCATPRELAGMRNVYFGAKNFARRGRYEEKTVSAAKHIIGRTEWDKACTYRINPAARYHHGNETLREEFYSGGWSAEKCTKHRIFISQAGYPVKGFHLFLEALYDIVRFYPDVTVHIAGGCPLSTGLIKGSVYGRYLLKLIKKYGLGGRIRFCGNLSAKQMKNQMLEANVFVSPSTIENSPNSTGEAMMLGVPIVSSNVGGVTDLLKHGEEGYLYQADAPYMLAHYVMKVFGQGEKAAEMGKAAAAHARATHDYEKNLRDLLDIYNDMRASD